MPLDDADKKLIGEMIAAGLKDGLTAEALGPVIGAALAPALKPITDAQAALTADLSKVKEAAAKPPEAKPTGKDGKPPDENATLLASLKAQIDDLTKQNEAERARNEQIEADRKIADRNTMLRDLLGKAGVPADRMDLALAGLLLNKIEPKADGSGHVWIGTVNGIQGQHPIDKGIGDWIKGPGSTFIPAKNVGGTGERQNGSGSGTPVTAKSFMAELGLNES